MLWAVCGQGLAEAQYNLADMYVTGEASDDCKTPDLQKAKYWFRRAAEQDDVEAMYNLGLVYQVRYPVDYIRFSSNRAFSGVCSACKQAHF
jgi:TPR repeat protein